MSNYVIIFVVGLIAVGGQAIAGVRCKGSIKTSGAGNKIAEIRCTHDGSGGSYLCNGSWKLRNVKGGEGTLSGNCGVQKGNTNLLCFGDEEIAGEKIKEQVDDPKITCGRG
ncbi:hypothetical protein MKK75_09185 [Methylobacterium sp. J-030]|uniref:hypothetical protein n=1 Tax=Methylobacterium sp. J-030 TaxID=2836627 RepID=UPI001FB97727|nr:hypothetical protein [Methylobacterium sp. J-030]MCJ2068973.1 hypothetical protein [Methylobacterium sp. J-030]